MLIICTGPDTFRARLKFRDLILAYKNKYDDKGSTIENLQPNDIFSQLNERLSSQSLFASKKMLICEGLMQQVTPKQTEKLSLALKKDADITVVLDYEDKAPKESLLKAFQEKELFIYKHEPAKGTELNKIVMDLCRRSGVKADVVPSLIQRYQSDLWAIDTALQVMRVSDSTDIADAQGEHKVDNVFAVADLILTGRKDWLKYISVYDPQAVLSTALPQMRTWHMVQDGLGKKAHPFVQKKLSSLKIKNPDEKLLNLLRAMYSSRNSLATGDEVAQVML
jgi:hypothetical protein